MQKVGISTAGWYDDKKPLASLQYIKECGFQSFDLNFSPYLNTTKANKEGLYPNLFDQSIEEILAFFSPLKEAIKQTGIAPSQIHAPYPTWFEGNDALNAYLLTVLDKSFAVCEFLECPAIVVHPVEGNTREEEWARNLANYRSIIPLIKKYKGLKCCLENLFVHSPSNFDKIVEGRLSNADEICRMHDLLNEEAGGDYFGICFDVGHANLTGRNIKEYVRQLGNRLTALHIHDNNGICDQHLAPYSCVQKKRAHVCDWNGFVEGLKEIDYKGTLSFETDNIFKVYPAAVHTEVLRLISAIGHYWVDELEK